MDFLKIPLKLFENLIGLLVSCFLNTSSHPEGGVGDQTMRTSSSSTSLPRQNYEVFLSFRGNDTRHNFTDHLYHRLVDRGIMVFRDSEELHVGEKIDQLFEAIKVSKISILIISPNYASSIWCLKELLQILECKKTSNQLVLPIFYHVKPSDIREQKGNFGKNFWLCRRKHHLDGKFVQELKNAFIEVATMKGWESDEIANGHEGELVKIVVTRIFNELRKAVLVVPDFFVGIDYHVEEIKKMIDASPSNDVKFIGIHGMGGIGKTTLAKVLYNVLSNDFECHSFVPNIREASKSKGMEALQKKLISDILVDKSLQEISHVDEGITIIEKSFNGKRILLLFDDVENQDQLNKLAAKNSWFGSESIVIITTRNKDVTMGSTANLSYELNELNYGQSYELFCKHVFGRDSSCPRELETVARGIVSMTGGLPLAIEIVGSLLCGKNEEFWKETLEKLRRVPNEKVRDKLKISYDSLEYGQQQIFLDVACFGFGYLPVASYMWKSCGFYPKEGIEKLISLSLLKMVGSHLIIHDQLRDLGKEIVHEEGRVNVGLCSRIWIEEEAIEVIERKLGTHCVQALELRAPRHYKSKDFEGMTNLRYLKIYKNVHLSGDFENHFLNLKCLIAHREFNMMGINFNPKKLVVLILDKNKISEYWKGWSQMKYLKVLSLARCSFTTTTPDFSAMSELEDLSLYKCFGLRKIHPSIGKLSKTLKTLSVYGCALKELPIEMGQMEELLHLDIGANLIREIPNFIGHLTKLERLSVAFCPQLLSIPPWIGMLSKLRQINTYGCWALESLPDLPSSISTCQWG